MEAATVSIDEVRSLVSERQRYDQWLKALDDRRNETPDRVFTRVRADYVSRRDGVMERLRAHEDMLSSFGSQLAARMTDLEAEINELEDSRAEAMLRTAVGEFDADRWDQVRLSVEARLEERLAARAAVQSEFEEVRMLLASARAESAVPAPGGQSAPNVSDENPTATGGSHEQESASNSVSATDELLDVGDSELFGANIRQPSPRDVTPVSVPDVMEAATLDIEEETIAVWESDTRSDATASKDLDVLPVSHAAESVTARDAAHTADDAFDDLAFLRSVVDPGSSTSLNGDGGSRATSNATDQQKTLRCTDCGTMNLPTEWYCERCGGELAAF